MYSLLAIAIASTTFSCADVVVGEHTRARCLPESGDEDMDGKPNCHDPDCQVFAECRGGGLAGAPTAGSGGAGAGDCARCPAGQVCDRGTCAPVGEYSPGRYTLMIDEVRLPESDADDACFDTADPNVAPTPTGKCPFKPDPYINVRLEGPTGAVTVLGTTETRANTLMPSFTTNVFELELGVADRIVLDVLDRDSPDADDLIFGCTAHRRPRSDTKLDCMPADITRVARGDFRVEASLLAR